ARVPQVHRHLPRGIGAARDATCEKRGEQLGKQRDEIKTHAETSSVIRLPIDRDAPAREIQDWEFEEIDIARVRLVYDLRRAMEVQEDTVPLVLSLLDQVYALRAELRSVLRAIDAQPAPVRESLRALLRRG
ncbi:MAG: hypothetical protein J0H35_10795, partial [Rhodospirillales bacterium]|nr:hypothetical protein [Rhodospirillales bacterium]